MVVCEGLAGGSRVLGCLARGSEVGKLGRGLSSVVLDVLRNGAWELKKYVSTSILGGASWKGSGIRREEGFSPLVTEL